MFLFGLGRKVREEETEKNMLKRRGGGLEAYSAVLFPCDSPVVRVDHRVGEPWEEDEAVLMCEWEGGSRQASVCFCAAEPGRGEGQAAVQCSAQLLSKLIFRSVSPPFSFSAGLGLLCLPEHCWQLGTSAKQSRLLLWPPWRTTGKQQTDAREGHWMILLSRAWKGSQLLPFLGLLRNTNYFLKIFGGMKGYFTFSVYF